jgi:hypothetical protein
MEFKDAIAIIKEHIVDIHADPEIYEDGSKVDILHALEEFAIPAMEKELDKNVVLTPSKVAIGREYYACPTCEEFIKWIYDIEQTYYEPDRCPWCGQTLNWKVN